MEDFSGYREVFIEELVDQIERIEKDLLLLEKEPSEQIIQSVFRAAHTIKGSSAAMGFERLSMLTHEMEHLLDLARSKKIMADFRLADILFAALDGITTLKNQYVAGENYSDISDIVNRLRSYSGGSGLHTLKVRIRIAADCLMKAARFLIIEKEIKENIGTILASEPAVDIGRQTEDADYCNLIFVINTDDDPAGIELKLSGLTDVQSVAVEAYQPDAPTNRASAEAKELPLDTKQKQGPQTIRVSVERMEHLMNLVGELLIDQTSLVQLKQSLIPRFPKENFVSRLGEVSDHMSRIVEELQECVMKARMLPIEHLFNRFPRMVRDLSQQLGKEVELIIEGVETELDRTLIEEISDPLIHLIRNAVDHGIEPAEARIMKGKQAKGCVRLNSFHEDNQIVITLEDDGGGINPEIIKASAVRKGIVTMEEAERLSEQEIIRLIFQPGFSTAASVSAVSGRGVGMDIVRNQIERLNGLIHVQTEVNKGTCFTVRLPLTLAIITGLMVRVGGREIVIPMNNVLDIVRFPVEEIRRIQGKQLIIIRDQVLPLVWLHDVLHDELTAIRRYFPVLVIGSAEKKIALAVDELLGNQDIVIKAMGSYLGKVPYMMGATILGNGEVAMILDVAGVIQMNSQP